MKKLVVLLVLLWASAASAQLTLGYRIVSTINYGFDSTYYPPDSCICYYMGAADPADIDSAYRLSTRFVEPRGYGKPDTCAAWTTISPADINSSAYNPLIVCYWYFGGATPFVLRDNSPQLSHIMRKVDSLQESITVGSAGSGPNDDTLLVYDSAAAAVVEGAQVIVESTGGVEETDWLTTDVTGRVVTHLAAATWNVYSNTPLYFQQTSPQQITNAGDQLDTIFVYSWTSTLPLPGDDSCIVNIWTDEPYAEAEIVMHGLAREDRERPVRDTNGVWLDRNEIRPRPVADVNGVISVALVRSEACSPNSAYDITVRNKYDKVIFTVEDYGVPNQTADTLLND